MAFTSVCVAVGWLFCMSAATGGMPDVDVQYEFASAGAAGVSAQSNFIRRASQLAASIGQADTRISEFEDVVGQVLRPEAVKERPGSFLASKLQPVDATHVRKSLAATEPQVSPAETSVNVIMGEDVGAMLEKAKYKGLVDQIVRLAEDFEHDVAELASGA